MSPTQYARLFSIRAPAPARCLTDVGEGEAPALTPCGAEDAAQQWSFRVTRSNAATGGDDPAGVTGEGFGRLQTYVLLLVGAIVGGAATGLWLVRRPRRRAAYASVGHRPPDRHAEGLAWRRRELERADDDTFDPRPSIESSYRYPGDVPPGRHRAPRVERGQELGRLTTRLEALRHLWADARDGRALAMSRVRSWRPEASSAARTAGMRRGHADAELGHAPHSCRAPLGLQNGRIVFAELGAGKGLISVSGDQTCARRLVATMAMEIASGRWGPETVVVATDLAIDDARLTRRRIRILNDVRDVLSLVDCGLYDDQDPLALMLGRPPSEAAGRRLAREAVASVGRLVVMVAGTVPSAQRRWWVSSDGWLHAEGTEFRLDFLDWADGLDGDIAPARIGGDELSYVVRGDVSPGWPPRCRCGREATGAACSAHRQESCGQGRRRERPVATHCPAAAAASS